MEGERGRVILVLGPHRTGTSATTRILNLLGLDLGRDDQLIRPLSNDNDKGFFENRPLMLVNQGLLNQMGGTWMEPPVLGPGWENDVALDGLRARARSLVANFAESPLWGFKDPRMCLTLPFWRELLGQPGYVICHRNMLEVARSLERRNGLPRRQCVAIWTRYMAAAIVNTSGTRRMFVCFDELFSARRRVLGELAAFVGVPELAGDSQFLSLVDQWLEDGLRHHSLGSDDVLTDPDVPADARLLHVMLDRAMDAHSRESSPDGSGIGGPRDAELDAAAFAIEDARLAKARHHHQDEGTIGLEPTAPPDGRI